MSIRNLIAALAISMATPQANAWHYEKSRDDMTGKISSFAMATSENAHRLSFPYHQGDTRAMLAISAHARHGKQVALSITQGQVICNAYDGCSALLRFDDRKPLRFTASPPASHQSTIIFLNDRSRFIRELSAAKKLLVELPIYQHGALQWRFDVSNFDEAKLR